MALADYLDREIDVLAFRGTQASGEVLLDASLLDEESTGEICTGIVKLAQRVLLEFLTIQGSIPHQPDRGCEMMQSLQTGKARTTADVRAIFALSELDVRANLQGEELEEDPADERYLRSTLKSVTVAPGQVTLSFELQSRADRATVILPVSIVV
jgi:hypothetical protein